MAYHSNIIHSLLSSETQKGIATYLQHKMTSLWPSLYGLSLLTIGNTHRVLPSDQWYPCYHIHGQFDLTSPQHNPPMYQTNCCINYDNFPFQDCSLDRMIYVHDIRTNKDQFELLLRSCWKTLNDDGKVILLLPNKLGWWSIIDNLSLRYRNTFLIQKLNRILTQNMFRISHYERVIYFPPKLMNLLSLRANKILDFLGYFFVPFSGGYHLIEIEKELYESVTVQTLQKKYILQHNFLPFNWNKKRNF